MEKVSGLRQRIAGKSIPLEVGREVSLKNPFPDFLHFDHVSMVLANRNSPLARHASIWLKGTG